MSSVKGSFKRLSLTVTQMGPCMDYRDVAPKTHLDLRWTLHPVIATEMDEED